MTPSVPLVAHYTGISGAREVSLRVIAITAQNVMLVLWENKLIPVHQPILGLKLDLVEELKVPPTGGAKPAMEAPLAKVAEASVAKGPKMTKSEPLP